MATHSSILVRESMDRGEGQAKIHGVAKSWVRLKRLRMQFKFGHQVAQMVIKLHFKIKQTFRKKRIIFVIIRSKGWERSELKESSQKVQLLVIW